MSVVVLEYEDTALVVGNFIDDNLVKVGKNFCKNQKRKLKILLKVT